MRARDFAYFDQPFIPLAHRGGSLLEGNQGRENTLEAFGRAVELGYRYLETDVHATRDGHLVAFHDDRLDRVSDRTGLIAELSLAEVRSARVGGDAIIPTLDEVLERFGQARLNIDIKAPGAVEPLARTLADHGAEDRVCVGSFGEDRLRRFRHLTGGRVATSAGPVGVAWTARVPLLPRLLASPAVAFQVPEEHVVRGRRVKILTPFLLSSAHRRGKVVHVWTVNDADRMDGLIDQGVDGIVTDAVDVLRGVLERRGMWPRGHREPTSPQL
ncbi:glycerophosphodiester phosphodiesterase [Luteococcus peritonei]|uniref:Glycerophosphodiester phosphodiesterase n=1 Tax=Luteococcus peritonei TaxID=88874 RepID=A0ABW4RW98_9ACTN